jgi:hypothetical protein
MLIVWELVLDPPTPRVMAQTIVSVFDEAGRDPVSEAMKSIP